MERMFPGSYGVSPEDREHALQTGIFSIDANVLCDLWRYSPETRDLLLNTMELLSEQGRLWIANQAVTELHRRRLKVIGDQRQRALDIIQFFGDFVKAVKGAVKSDRHHPTLQLEKLEAIAIDANKKATTLWNEAKQNAINPYNDPILRRLTTIVGEGFGHDPVDDLNATKEAALQRIAACVPPGYMDDGKDDGGIGDVLIWMELLQLGKTRQLPIVFVTSDGKEDWWEKMKDDSGEKRIGPRHELVAEMQHQAGVIYVQMDPEELQRYGDTVLNIETPEEVFEELREVSQEPEPEPVRHHVTSSVPGWMAAASWPSDQLRASALLAMEQVAHVQAQSEQHRRALAEAMNPAAQMKASLQALSSVNAAAANRVLGQAGADLIKATGGGAAEQMVKAMAEVAAEERIRAMGEVIPTKGAAETALGLSVRDPAIDPRDDD